MEHFQNIWAAIAAPVVHSAAPLLEQSYGRTPSPPPSHNPPLCSHVYRDNVQTRMGTNFALLLWHYPLD